TTSRVVDPLAPVGEGAAREPSELLRCRRCLGRMRFGGRDGLHVKLRKPCFQLLALGGGECCNRALNLLERHGGHSAASVRRLRSAPRRASTGARNCPV